MTVVESPITTEPDLSEVVEAPEAVVAPTVDPVELPDLDRTVTAADVLRSLDPNKQIVGKFFDGEGGYCAIGGLLLHAAQQ